MKKLDKLLLRSFFGSFIAILLVVIFILVMQFLWLYIDELVGKGLSLLIILEFLAWGGTSILPTALPLATLLAAMWALGQMSENNELIAVKAAGISLARTMAPLFIASLIISAATYVISDRVVPLAWNKMYTFQDDIQNTNSEIKIPSGIFYNGIEGYVLRVDERNKDNGMLYGVMVYDHTDRKGNINVTLADSALLKMSKSKDYLTFTLYNGTNYAESNTRAYRDTSYEVQKINFRKQDLIIPLENYSFEKSDSTRFSDQVKTMRKIQLVEFRDSLDRNFTQMHQDHLRMFIYGGNFSKYRQLDTATIEKELKPFECDNYMIWDNASDEYFAYEQALNKAVNMETQLVGMGRELNESLFYLRRVNLCIHKLFSVALACLLLFFIGAPLGSLVKKGQLGGSAILSVLFFVLYWVVNSIGEKMAKDGAMSPFEGSFLMVLLLAPMGAFFTWKAVNDSSLFNMDQFKSSWRRIKTKVMSIFRKTRIVYMGTPEFAVAPLKALIDKGYNIVGVVTVADKPSGRGLKMNESAVKKFAVEHGIPVLQPVKLKDPEFLEALSAWKADLFVVVAFRMLPKEVWSMPKLGTFNLHAALLPQYRGAAPINWAVINGEQITGVTTFMIDENIDTGSIMLRQDYRIKPSDNAGDVHDALMEIGASLVCDTVEGLIEGNIELRVQRSFVQGSEQLKPAPKLSRELCHIDWNDKAKNIHNLIRGLSPYPAAFTEILPIDESVSAPAVQLKIYSSEIMSTEEAGRLLGASDGLNVPGSILSDGKGILAIRTADGFIKINELQLAGKKRMDTKTFLLGFRNPQNYRCTEGSSKALLDSVRK